MRQNERKEETKRSRQACKGESNEYKVVNQTLDTINFNLILL